MKTAKDSNSNSVRQQYADLRIKCMNRGRKKKTKEKVWQ